MHSNQKALDLQLLNRKKVGLLGGSFNPAHTGHLEMSKYAIDKLGLDHVIWLVTPQNPLKPPYAKTLEERAEYAAEVANKAPIIVSIIEKDIKSTCTYDTLLYFRKSFPETEFTWLMGGDCLGQLHLWEHFDEFTNLMNIAIFNRTSTSGYVESTIGGKFLKKESLKNNQFRVIFCDNKLVDISSTEIRSGIK